MEQRLFLVSVTLTGLLNTSFEQSKEDGTISSAIISKLDHFQTLVSVNEKLNPVKSGIRTRRQSSLEEGGRAARRGGRPTPVSPPPPLSYLIASSIAGVATRPAITPL